MSENICGYPTQNGEGPPCQHDPTHEDGRCYHHTDKTEANNLGRPSKLDNNEDEILEFASEGLSKRKIAEKVGVSGSTLSRHLERNPQLKERFEEIYSYTKYVPYKYVNPDESGVINKECDYCGEKTEVAKCRLVHYDSHYCDENCQRLDQFNQNSRSYEGPNWREQREKALERDGYSCQSCGVSQAAHVEKLGYGLHVHHIVPRRHFRDDDPTQNDLDNLITLCHSCHGVYENTCMSPVDRQRDSDDPITTKTP